MQTANTFADFERELSSGKLKPVYFIAASDNYFIKKATDILKTKMFDKKLSDENFFLKYADESKYDDVLDLCRNFASLFAAKKLIVVKRCERYSRNLNFILEYAMAPNPDTVLVLVFDKDYLIELKRRKEIGFYDFSELPEQYFSNWVRMEFASRGCTIKEPEFNLFVSSVSYNFDLIVQEMEKIANYIDATNANEKVITEETILYSIGFTQTHTPEDLIVSILDRDIRKCTHITHYLLNKSGINEIYLLAIISNYFIDLLSFKTKGVPPLNSFEIHNRYKIWRERANFAKIHSSKISVSQIRPIFRSLLETDKNLKTSMINPKILMTSLIEDLINS